MLHKPVLSRVAEVILSLGIPAIGYLGAVGQGVNLHSLSWQIPATLLAAWHVILINDNAFGKQTSVIQIFFAKKNIPGALLIPVALLPSLYLSPLFGIMIFLTILNWNIYSLKGKRFWLSGLMHNFAGGALHFLIGVAATAKFANLQTLLIYWPEMLFFAFTMTAGAMHHDSFDAEEDKSANYATGAVKFSPDRWWRLAALPFIAGIFILLFSNRLFALSFLLPSSLYLILYTVISFKQRPSSVTIFRSICRVAFLVGAFIYLLKTQFQ